MNSGIYAALSGNLAAQKRLDTLTNNLANVNTAGYKKDRVLFESVLSSVKNPSPANGTVTGPQAFSGVSFATDFSAGPVRQSGNPLDLALEGDGFFVVNTPQGRAYTRQGNFHISAGGRLVTAEGYEVLGNGNPVTITGKKVEIDATGGVNVDGARVAALDIVDLPKPYQLVKESGTLFRQNGQGGEAPARGTAVRQGYLEGSNVNPLLEMVNLVETNRYFESCAKAVANYDALASKAANDLGKL